jgi:predicted transcriptional regulator
MNYQGLLQGFFAGEGNLKTGEHGARALRIAQGARLNLLEKILRYYELPIHYESSGRNCVIWGRENLEKLFLLGVSELHLKKHAKFISMLASYKQRHYSRNLANQIVLKALANPLTARQVAESIGRTRSRAIAILRQLRNKNQVEMFKVRSSYYWMRVDCNSIVISFEKSRILDTLDHPLRTFEIANILGIESGNARRRLAELTRLGLVQKRNSNWCRIEVRKRVIVK